MLTTTLCSKVYSSIIFITSLLEGACSPCLVVCTIAWYAKMRMQDGISLLDPCTRQFSDFPAFVDEHLSKLANKRVLMYCTGQFVDLLIFQMRVLQ